MPINILLFYIIRKIKYLNYINIYLLLNNKKIKKIIFMKNN